jgi:hypothetical protein
MATVGRVPALVELMSSTSWTAASAAVSSIACEQHDASHNTMATVNKYLLKDSDSDVVRDARVVSSWLTGHYGGRDAVPYRVRYRWRCASPTARKSLGYSARLRNLLLLPRPRSLLARLRISITYCSFHLSSRYPVLIHFAPSSIFSIYSRRCCFLPGTRVRQPDYLHTPSPPLQPPLIRCSPALEPNLPTLAALDHSGDRRRRSTDEKLEAELCSIRKLPDSPPNSSVSPHTIATSAWDFLRTTWPEL